MKLTQNILYYVGFALLLFLSFFPRGVEILNHNYLFLLDQGRDYMAVRNIVVNHHFTLIGSQVGWGYAGIQGIFQGPFHYYFLAIPFWLSHGNPYSGIVLMFFYGLSSIALGFYLGKKLFGLAGGLIASLLIALSPALIVDSRYVWNPHSAEVFLLIALFFVYQIHTRKWWAFFLSSFFVAFSYNFELANTAPLFLAFILYIIFVVRPNLKQYLVIILAFCVGFLPAILFDMKHHFLAVQGIISYFSHAHSVKGYGLINNVLPFIYYNAWDSFPHFLPIDSLFAFLFLIIFTVYFWLKEKTHVIKQFFIFFFFLLISNIIVFSLLRSWIYMYYFIDLNFVYIFSFTFLLIRSYQKSNKIVFCVFGILFVWMMTYGTISAYTTMHHDLPDYGGTAKIKGKIDAVDYIYKDAKGKPFGLFIFSPDIYTDPFDYTILWYGQQKYHYLPTTSKNGIFYLWIEKDPSKPWTYKGWEETVIKNGKVLKTITLPSGFIIEKREG